MSDPQVDETSGDPNIRILREKASGFDKAAATAAALQRENALLRSGLDLTHPITQLFEKGYDGPLTAEALKEEAAKYGVPLKGQAVDAEVPGEAEITSEEPLIEDIVEPTGTAERSALADGSPPDTGLDLDPRETANRNFDARLAAGAPREDAAAAMINELANAAARGDQRVIVPNQ